MSKINSASMDAEGNTVVAVDDVVHQEQKESQQSADRELNVNTGDERDHILEATLERLTRSLPRHELKIMIQEAMECEAALLQEIRVLEEARNNKSNINFSNILSSTILPSQYNPNLQSTDNFLSTAEDIFGTVFAPHDRYFSLSALLGRLREPFATPPTPHSRNGSSDSWDLQKKVHRKSLSASQTGDGGIDIEKTLAKHKALLALQNHKLYTHSYPIDQQNVLLSLWKRISGHRSAMVFRKPVNPDEAPGYREKIQFPMDLSLIRKLITSGQVASLQQLHEYLGLICHNCIKFNGRESDYGNIAREFECYVDESILDTIQKMEANTGAFTSVQNGEGIDASTEQVDVSMEDVNDATAT